MDAIPQVKSVGKVRNIQMVGAKMVEMAKSLGRAFLRGVGSVLDISGSSHSSSFPEVKTPRPSSVSDALARDWQKVGQDMRSAMDQYEKTLHEQQNP